MTVFLVTGIQAAGKSTVAQALAERLDRPVHVRGDIFRRMVVNGRAEMGPVIGHRPYPLTSRPQTAGHAPRHARARPGVPPESFLK